MFKILLISIITIMLVIITLLIFMSFMNVDIKTNSKPIEHFFNEEPSFTGGGTRKSDHIIFTSDGSITFNSETICEVLIVGGGGGGARNEDWEGGGGGGGGGVGYGSITFNNGTYNIKIGSGGSEGGINSHHDNGRNGGNTSIIGGLINETAYGGGGGGWRPGLIGGSGGGGSGHAGSFSGGNPNKGNSLSDIYKVNITYYGNKGGFGNNQSGGGGGGGAGSEGLTAGYLNYNGGNGGNGKEFFITGEKKYYGGGGGGASGCHGGCNKANGTIPGNGGLGGGGRGGHRNQPTNGETNTGGGGGGSSKGKGGTGGSGIVIIKYRNISNINSSITDVTNLFTNKKPWGMYFAEDSDLLLLKDASGNGRDAEISGNVFKKFESGNGASSKITYITGGTSSTISWPHGSIPKIFTILSLTRYNGGSRRRILSNDRNGGNWLHGHWEGRRGLYHYDYWIKGDPSIGTTDDWLCSIGKNTGNIPNNLLIDGVPYGDAGGGGGGYKLGINNNPWGENSDWALSCVIIWDRHLDDNEMLLLNRLINNYKNTGKPLIDIINNTVNSSMYTENNQNSAPLTRNEKFISDNQAFNYIIKYDSSMNMGNLKLLKQNDYTYTATSTNPPTIFNNNRFSDGTYTGSGSGETIHLKFKEPFILKKIIFVANQRNNAPAAWNINIGGNILSGTATSEDYDVIEGKSENYCIKFFIDNQISSDTYDIIFTRTIGGTQLNFNKVMLYEGIKPEDISTASVSIDSTTAGMSMYK